MKVMGIWLKPRLSDAEPLGLIQIDIKWSTESIIRLISPKI